jgi:hypothetical protein
MNTHMRLVPIAFVAASLFAPRLAAQGQSGGPVASKGVIAESDLLKIAQTAKSLRVEPTSLTIKVGQRVTLDTLTVTVIDSAGRVRGRLTGFDFVNIKPGEPASVVPRTLTGVHAGTTELVIRYPKLGWKRPDLRPEAKVRVMVTP